MSDPYAGALVVCGMAAEWQGGLGEDREASQSKGAHNHTTALHTAVYTQTDTHTAANTQTRRAPTRAGTLRSAVLLSVIS